MPLNTVGLIPHMGFVMGSQIHSQLYPFMDFMEDSQTSTAAVWSEEKQHMKVEGKTKTATCTSQRGLSARAASKHSSPLRSVSIHNVYTHTEVAALCKIKCECMTRFRKDRHEQKDGRCIMGRQKVWAHSLCKQISRLMFGCIKSPRWYTHSLLPIPSLWNINLMCMVAFSSWIGACTAGLSGLMY